MLLCWQLFAGSVSDDLTTASGITKYIAAFYYVTTFLSTVGFGDITATTNAERIVATIMMFVGAQLQVHAQHSASQADRMGCDGQLQMCACASVCRYFVLWFPIGSDADGMQLQGHCCRAARMYSPDVTEPRQRAEHKVAPLR
jgi:Ion channel